jgi:ElaB/YqjD/DUF883 family membrane-anchored ribosome-binding protein
MDTTTGTSSTDRLHSTVDKAAQGAHQALDRVAARAAPAVEKVREKAMLASDTLHAKMDDLSVAQEQWMGTLREQVRAHPLAVVGGAVLAGLLIGRLMR